MHQLSIHTLSDPAGLHEVGDIFKIVSLVKIKQFQESVGMSGWSTEWTA